MNEAIQSLWPVLAFMGVQTVTVTWWAATQTQRVARLEDDAKNHNGLGERMAKLETTLENVQGMLEQLVEDLKPRRR